MNNRKYIGMDVHQASISIAVSDAAGKVLMECIIETKAATVLEFIQVRVCESVTRADTRSILERPHHSDCIWVARGGGCSISLWVTCPSRSKALDIIGIDLFQATIAVPGLTTVVARPVLLRLDLALAVTVAIAGEQMEFAVAGQHRRAVSGLACQCPFQRAAIL